MSTATPSLEQLLETILARPAADRAVIAEVVADSLHPPDPEIERAWAVEAESRLDAYRKGQIKAVPFDEVFKTMETP
jgi:putative addiction module component (TIGR02574 family)